MIAADPLVLEKTAAEIFKSSCKNLALTLGIDIHEWNRITDHPQLDNAPRLSPEELKKITEYSDRVAKGLKDQLEQMTDEEFANSIEYQPVPLMDEILARNATENAAVNVGCAYVRAEAELCRKYPHVQWDMLDLTNHVANVNEGLGLENARYHACYPLEWLEERQTRVRYDLALFNRVLVRLPNAEVHSYFKVLSACSRHIVFCEPACVLRFMRSVNIDRIDPQDSLISRDLLRLHNYRKMLDEYGFDLIHYQATRMPVHWFGEQQYCVLGVARNRAL